MINLDQQSLDRLDTCHRDLVMLFRRVSVSYPCKVLEGHRGEQAQNAAFATGKSQLRFPDGKHNALPSMAVDVAPLPLDWNDREAFSYFAGFVKGIAECMGLKIRWGGDWDDDRNLKNNKFDDLVHFELVVARLVPPVIA